MFDIQKNYKLIIFFSALLTAIGLFSAKEIRNRLLPNMSLPEIGVTAVWPGKTAKDIEKTLVVTLEKELKQVSGVKNIVSYVDKGTFWTSVTFHADTDMEKAYSEIQSRANQVPNWPLNAQKPLIFDFSNGANTTLTSFYLHADNSTKPEDFIRVFKNTIEPSLMNVKGVSGLKVSLQSIDERLNIVFNEQKLVNFGLTIDDVIFSLSGLSDSSGGDIQFGKSTYQMVFKGELPIEELNDHIIKANKYQLIKLSDIARVEYAISDEWKPVTYNGRPALFFFAQPSQDVDVTATVDRIKNQLDYINKVIEIEHGFKVSLIGDDAKTINESILFIVQSVTLGLFFSGLVVLIMIKEFKSLILIQLSIPFSLSVVFLAMWLLDKNIHLISLAGISLSVGLIVDAAIITMESIQSELKYNSYAKSIKKGVGRVKSALLSSTLTSIVVFVPILFIDSKEGQLFDDLAFVISIALLASIFYSLIVLPSLCSWLKIDTKPKSSDNTETVRVSSSSYFLNKLKNKTLILSVFLVIFLLSLASIIGLRPDFDVIPDPKMQDINVYLHFDSKLSKSAIKEKVTDPINMLINQSIEQGTAPTFSYFDIRCKLGCSLNFKNDTNLPIEVFDTWLNEYVFDKVIGVDGYPRKESLLSLVLPNQKNLEMDFMGASMQELNKVSVEVQKLIESKFDKAIVYNSNEDAESDLQFEFNHFKDKLAFSGLSVQSFNNYLVALTYGYYIGDYYYDGKLVSTYVKGEEVESIEDLLNKNIITPSSKVRKVRELTESSITEANSTIMRVNNSPVVSLFIEAPEDISMERFTDALKRIVYTYQKENNVSNVAIQYRGSSNDMGKFLIDFAKAFGVATFVLFGLLYLFTRSSKASLIVMMSLPVSIGGGVFFLYIFGLFKHQNLDMISIIGFIMLIGLVINNGILLITSYMDFISKGSSVIDSISLSLSSRKRAIILSTMTSVVGMLPLLNPTAVSSEIYQGLAISKSGMGSFGDICLGFNSLSLKESAIDAPVRLM